MNKKFIQGLAKTSISIGISLFVAIILIIIISDSPLESIRLFLTGPLTEKRYFGNIIEMWIPLVFTGLSISIMFQAKQFNIGAEGAFYGGAVAAALVAVFMPMAAGLHSFVAIAAAAVIGSAICFVPAIAKTKFGSSELVVSMMMNYIAFFTGLYFLKYVLRDPASGSPASYKLAATAVLPKIFSGTRIHFGFVIVIVIAIALYLFVYRTSKGYEVRAVGENQRFSKYVGVKVSSIVLLSQIIGGAVAGIGGAVELLGMYTRFNWTRQTGFGWDGIIVAALALNNPLVCLISAFFLAYIRIGADIMSRNSNVPNELVSIIQGFIILLLASQRLLTLWKKRKNNSKLSAKNSDKLENV